MIATPGHATNAPVYITGIGMNCSLGMSSGEIHDALMDGTPGISDIEILRTRHRGTFPVGEVKASTEALRNQLDYEDAGTVNRTTLLAALAVKQALAQVGNAHLQAERLGLFSGTTVGGMDTTEDGFESYLDGRIFESNFLETNDCGYSTEFLADLISNVTYLTTSATACSSSLNSIGAAVQMLRDGELDMAVAGGADALCRFTINGFNSFMLLDQRPCRPFDTSRSGINLGEGAAYFVLESEASLKRSGNTPLACISGFGNSNDAFHPTGISATGEGIQRSMNGALTDARLGANLIDYVITHGTGTPNNDASEGAAIHCTFCDEVPAYVSLKSSIGHTLGASGALNVGMGISAIRNGVLYGNRNFSEMIPEHRHPPLCTTSTDTCPEHVLVNAAGMGGFCSSLIVSKV